MARVHSGRPKVLAAYRSYHGSTTTSIHLTGDPRRWPRTPARRARSTSSAPSCIARRSDRPRPRKSASGRSHLRAGDPSRRPVDDRRAGPGVGDRQLGRHRAADRLPARVRISHPSWHRLHRRRGTRRLRPHWCLVRNRPRRRRPRPHGFAKGVNRVCAARRRIGRRFGVRDFHPTSVSGGPDLQRTPTACAAAVGAIQAMHDEGTVAAASRPGADILGPGSRSLPRPTPAWGTFVASADCGHSSWFVTGRRRSRSSRWRHRRAERR